MEGCSPYSLAQDFIFLDEPTIGLDVVMQKKMRDFIREYNPASLMPPLS